MKAARILGSGDIKYVDIDTPKAGDHDVLIKVKRAGVCGTDLALYNGDMPYIKNGDTKYPITPGHEWSGIIEETGKKVKTLKEGDRVTGDVSLGCGSCKVCLRGDFHICLDRQEVGSFHNKDGGYAEYILMPERHTYKIPDGISFDAGAMTEPAATVVYTIERVRIHFGDVVVVQGTGSIGILAAQAAKAAGASRVIMTGRNLFKLDFALKNGVDEIVNIKEGNALDKVLSLSEGRGADVVIEASGAIEAMLIASKYCRLGGRIGVVGIYENTLNGFDMSEIVLKDLTLHGTLASPRVFPRTIGMMASGRLKCDPLITHRFDLKDVEKAFKASVEDNARRIKIMLEVS